jgi:hypothetical protein
MSNSRLIEREVLKNVDLQLFVKLTDGFVSLKKELAELKVEIRELKERVNRLPIIVPKTDNYPTQN